jgi:hypothetical protein
MGMVEVGEDTGFREKCFDRLGLGDSLGAGNFDRNGPMEIVIVRQNDLTEAPSSNLPEKGISPYLGTIEERAGARRLFTRGLDALG